MDICIYIYTCRWVSDFHCSLRLVHLSICQPILNPSRNLLSLLTFTRFSPILVIWLSNLYPCYFGISHPIPISSPSIPNSQYPPAHSIAHSPALPFIYLLSTYYSSFYLLSSILWFSWLPSRISFCLSFGAILRQLQICPSWCLCIYFFGYTHWASG